MTEQLWGIIRYAAVDDGADFDGWYSHRSSAQEVYDRWLEQYPGWHIALVIQDDAQRSKGRAVVRCKDCDATCDADDSKGWHWIDLVDPPDECNGWRCPQCVAGWKIIVDERASVEWLL
jgi:hypothetical protein